METLTKYKSFDDLKSSESLKTEDLLNSKYINEFEEFISLLQALKKAKNQPVNRVEKNEQ
jgi:hypothetical protein